MSYIVENIFSKWKPELIRLAKTFYDEVCLIDGQYGKILEYNEKFFDKVHKKYSKYREKLHGIAKENNLIDRHKVLAAILLAFTDKDNLIFRINKKAVKQSKLNNFPFYIMYPNEYYLSLVLQSLLSEFNLATKKIDMLRLNKDNYDVQFPDKVTCWETNMSKSYIEHFIELLFALIMIKDDVTKCLLLLSHLIFFYELAYDCAMIEDLRKSYYQ